MNCRLFALLAVFLAGPAIADSPAKPARFRGTDVSGVYDCKGVDRNEGEYSGKVTITLVPEQSTGPYAAYSFKLEVPGFGTYLGQAAGRGSHLAIHFALTDPVPKDYGTGIANFRKNKLGKWVFEKYYYEPEYKGGNYGIETCKQRND